MKREPRITLPIKKPAKVDKLEPQWRLWIWYFLVTLLVLWVWQELGNQVEYRTIPYSEFKTYLAQGACRGGGCQAERNRRTHRSQTGKRDKK